MKRMYDKDNRSPYSTEYAQQYDNAVVKLALQRIAMDGLSRFDISCETSEFEKASKRHYEKMEPRIRRIIKRNIGRKRSWATAKAGWSVAVATVLVFAGLTTAIAFIPTMRHTVLKLLISREEAYTELRLVEDRESSFDFPASWGGHYYPTLIPAGFVRSREESLRSYSSVAFTNGDKELTFTEYNRDTAVQINTEGMIVETVEIRGEMGQCAISTDRVFVYWNNHESYFVLEFDGSFDITLRIAQSVVRVK